MTTDAWIVVLIGGLGTYLIRLSFLAAADRFGDLGPRSREVLRMIPPAALAALVAPAVLRPDGAVAFGAEIPAMALAMYVMHRTRNVLLTLVAGLGALILLQTALG